MSLKLKNKLEKTNEVLKTMRGMKYRRKCLPLHSTIERSVTSPGMKTQTGIFVVF